MVHCRSAQPRRSEVSPPRSPNVAPPSATKTRGATVVFLLVAKFGDIGYSVCVVPNDRSQLPGLRSRQSLRARLLSVAAAIPMSRYK